MSLRHLRGLSISNPNNLSKIGSFTTSLSWFHSAMRIIREFNLFTEKCHVFFRIIRFSKAK